MKSLSLTGVDYDAINKYIRKNAIKLLIIDFNGVLDDYNAKKVEFFKDLLGLERMQHLPELLLFIERAYMADRTATVERSYEKFLEAIGDSLTDIERTSLDNRMFVSKLTDDAKEFLDSLTIPYVIYTALSNEQAARAMDISKYDIFTRDQYEEAKPSIKNLTAIIERYGMLPEDVCVVGDGLIDDLMPASLAGFHSILVSPYAQALIRSR